MNIELRAVTEDEYPEFARVAEGAFGFHLTREVREQHRASTELDRTIGAFEGSELLATAGAFSLELTLPGGRLEPAAGVTAVAVRNTHRRRGLLREMMDHQLDDVADRGECMALLTASEGSIYRRFGYGPASYGASWTIDTAEVAVHERPDTGGRLRQVTRTEAITLLPAVYERCRPGIVGAINRPAAWWDFYFTDHEFDRDGASARFYVIHESDEGAANGLLAFRQRRSWPNGLAGNTIVIDELHGATPEIDAALWLYAIDHDLVATVEASDRPVDETIRWWLTNPRRLVCTDLVDRLWVRPLDIARTLAARTYRTDDALVLGIVDPFRPANDGAYLVRGGPDGTEAERCTRAPDLSMDVAELGSIYLGGVTTTSLARAGRLAEHSPGALARADAFFGTSPLPWLTTGF